MKIIKSILAVMLVLCCCLPLAACGPTDEGTNDTTTTKAAATTKADSTDGTATVTTAKVTSKETQITSITDSTDPKVSQIDTVIARTTNSQGNASAAFVKGLKGYKLKVYYPWLPEAKGSVKELKESALASQQAVEKEFGVEVTEDGKFDNYNETLTANLTARNVECQVYMVQNFNYASYFKNNYMTDLSKAMKTSGVNFSDPWYVSSANAFFNVNYKQYGWIAFDAEYVFPYSIVYNKTLVKKAKLTDPTTLAAQGKWTWDTLIKYAKKLTTSSVVGFGTVNKTMMLESMIQQSGTSLVSVSKGKQPSSNITNQKVKDALSTLYTWCKDDKICNTFSNQDWTYGKTQFAAGKVAMMFGTHDLVKTLSAKKTTDDFGIVQFPTKSGTKSYTNISDPQFICFIPSMYKNEADKILFLRNELYRQNYRYASRNFTYQWNKYFDDDDVLEYACNIKYGRSNNKTVFSWQSVCLKSDAKATFSTVVDHVLKNNGAVQQAIDKYNTAINKAFSDVWDGYKITGKV